MKICFSRVVDRIRPSKKTNGLFQSRYMFRPQCNSNVVLLLLRLPLLSIVRWDWHDDCVESLVCSLSKFIVWSDFNSRSLLLFMGSASIGYQSGISARFDRNLNLRWSDATLSSLPCKVDFSRKSFLSAATSTHNKVKT